MRNARLDEAKAGIKMAKKNINNLRYTGDTTLMEESKEEWVAIFYSRWSSQPRDWTHVSCVSYIGSLLMKAKEESEKAGLKPNIQKTKIMASGPITSW